MFREDQIRRVNRILCRDQCGGNIRILRRHPLRPARERTVVAAGQDNAANGRYIRRVHGHRQRVEVLASDDVIPNVNLDRVVHTVCVRSLVSLLKRVLFCMFTWEMRTISY